MASRRRRDKGDDERIHQEMLEHLAQNPPPAKKTKVPKTTSPSKSRKKADAPLRPRPELMLRRLRLVTAMDRLDRFVAHHRQQKTPEVLVVVGKGLGSGEDGPVIGPAVLDWCAKHPEAVIDARPAPAAAGGSGALLLKLRP